MEKVKLPVHDHDLFLSDRVFRYYYCVGCGLDAYFYGGYLCNELGCNTFFHKECVQSVQEIKHPSHPKHPLKLKLKCGGICSLCISLVQVGYHCSICNFTIHLVCARRSPPTPLPSSIENSKVHQHPLLLCRNVEGRRYCKVCESEIHFSDKEIFECGFCDLLFHWECVGLFPDVYSTSHPKHPLKLINFGAQGYAHGDCLLCGMKLVKNSYSCDKVYHCGICNVTICKKYCIANPPPVSVVSLRTHEHQLNLVPRLIKFTCDACGTEGDRSPYFCLQCNFMIHRACIDLPRVININRHNHRISYTRQLGQGNLTCGVCRQKVDGFYGGYSCSKCPSYVVHARCATRDDVWDRVELEGTPEEEEIAPFEVIDEYHIKHISHDHVLKINKDGKLMHESKLCEACASQINDDPSYGCVLCDFILHETCANLPTKMKHPSNTMPFILQTDTDTRSSPRQRRCCDACYQEFTGFRYEVKSGYYILDVRCSSISDPFLHESHSHHLYYKYSKDDATCSICETTDSSIHMLSCDECGFQMDFRCATLPRKVMNQRYDDHPLCLSYGEDNEYGQFWCEVCEKKLDPKEWFYTCNPCGTTLHVSCVVGDFSNYIPGLFSLHRDSYGTVIPNTSSCRPKCFRCFSRCSLPYILQVEEDSYFCSHKCYDKRGYWDRDYNEPYNPFPRKAILSEYY